MFNEYSSIQGYWALCVPQKPCAQCSGLLAFSPLELKSAPKQYMCSIYVWGHQAGTLNFNPGSGFRVQGLGFKVQGSMGSFNGSGLLVHG